MSLPDNDTNHAVAASDLTIEQRAARNSRALDCSAFVLPEFPPRRLTFGFPRITDRVALINHSVIDRHKKVCFFCFPPFSDHACRTYQNVTSSGKRANADIRAKLIGYEGPFETFIVYQVLSKRERNCMYHVVCRCIDVRSAVKPVFVRSIQTFWRHVFNGISYL